MRQLLLLCSLVFGVSAAHACSCMGPNPVCSSFWTTPVVFHGRVLERKLIPNIIEAKRPDGSIVQLRGNGVYEVRFAVEEMFRGDMRVAEITVKTNEQSSACGFDFKDDGDYVVFTYEGRDDKALWTSHCSRTHEVAKPEDADLEWMRSLPRATNTARIFGAMNLGTMKLPAGESTLPKVSVHGPVERQAGVDATGKFSFDGLPAGQYSVSVALPAGFTTNPPQGVTVVPKGCSEVYVPVRFDSHLRGRVTDSSGTALPNLLIVIETPDSNYPNRMRQVNLMSTDAEGQYHFDGLPPGDYYVEANSLGPAADRPYSTVFYGGSHTAEAAAPVRLEAAATASHIDITLPEAWQPVEVQVRVVMPDGSPAVGADVRAYDTEFSRSVTPFTARLTHSAGTVTVYRERSYYLVATLNVPDGQRCGGPVRFTTANDVPAQTVIIEHGWGNCLAQLDPRFKPR